MLELDEARDKISYGRERRKLMDDEDRKITAYHEAGHAIVQAVVDDGTLPVYKVTIIPRGQSLGSTMFYAEERYFKSFQETFIESDLLRHGGRCAEENNF